RGREPEGRHHHRELVSDEVRLLQLRRRAPQDERREPRDRQRPDERLGAERLALPRPAPPVQQCVARRRYMEFPLMPQRVVDDDPLPVLLNLDRTVHGRAPDSTVTFVPSSISIRSFSNLSALSTNHTCSWSARRLSYSSSSVNARCGAM